MSHLHSAREGADLQGFLPSYASQLPDKQTTAHLYNRKGVTLFPFTSQLTIISVKAYLGRVTLLCFVSQMMNYHEMLKSSIMEYGPMLWPKKNSGMTSLIKPVK